MAGALSDGFAPDVLESARWLAENDHDPQRGATVLGVVLLQTKDHAGAREVLERAISRHGENAYLLSNLARVYAALGDQERAEALIWRALELDPNEATSLNWLIANLSAKGRAAGGAGGLRAGRRPFREAGGRSCGWRAMRWRVATWRRRRSSTKRRWVASSRRRPICSCS